MGLGQEVVRLISKGKPLPILSSVEVRTFEADRGLTWKDAFEKFSTLTLEKPSFSKKATPILVHRGPQESLYTISGLRHFGIQ